MWAETAKIYPDGLGIPSAPVLERQRRKDRRFVVRQKPLKQYVRPRTQREVQRVQVENRAHGRVAAAERQVREEWQVRYWIHDNREPQITWEDQLEPRQRRGGGSKTQDVDVQQILELKLFLSAEASQSEKAKLYRSDRGTAASKRNAAPRPTRPSRKCTHKR
ncbi:hypothetical protein B0H19DRAFT_1069625 [Mycena capillaripes]|nr:hypothetical protein B0H19DRAFT_1069625 [Mycena capillaripes]